MKIIGTILLSCFSAFVFAQHTRIRDNNTIGWWCNFTTIKFSKKWSGHLEYQWRREHVVKDWQQSLVRAGVNYQPDNKVLLRIGYAFAETFPYGDYPLQAAGKPFPEHRMYEMVTVSDKICSLDLNHRFMLEQRWIGRFTNSSLNKPDAFTYVNRMRYMIRLQKALNKREMADKTLYVALYDELFIGFGKNVNENVFDQNRLGMLLGYRFSKTFRAETGFLNQVVQLGREINGSNVFQYNNGIILNTYVNIGK